MKICTCGRSLDGFCTNWHDLTEEEYQTKKIIWQAIEAAEKVAVD
tara:strand:+ start:497 stop:631 length:135 start_codon:yes stop_codon:yes gene_type:complete